MKINLYTFQLDLNWELISLISQIDRFDASWASLQKQEFGQLKQLKSFATINSVGASTRIEGSQMSDDSVDQLLKKLDITKLEERDAQEVVGYYDALELIHASYDKIDFTEGNIKNLHNLLLKYSIKDKWHKGEYKQHSNAVEATFPDGSKQIIFKTTAAGLQTKEAMQSLLIWFQKENTVHPLVKCALFAYEFLSIHPFQDGNGRLSRLLTNLILLQHHYSWLQYVSFEHEIEIQKTEYYRQLRLCQSQRPNEDTTPWVLFFLNALRNVQISLKKKLTTEGSMQTLSSKEKLIYIYIQNHSGCKSSDISNSLELPLPTIKRLLAKLVKVNLINKQGVGPSTNYFAF